MYKSIWYEFYMSMGVLLLTTPDLSNPGRGVLVLCYLWLGSTSVVSDQLDCPYHGYCRCRIAAGCSKTLPFIPRLAMSHFL